MINPIHEKIVLSPINKGIFIVKYNTISGLHAEILAKHPKAVTLLEHVINKGTLEIGTTIINHPNVPPTTITKAMLERNFPSLQDSFWWYVI